MTLSYRLQGKDRLAALRIVGIYALFSGLWILLSDRLLGILFQDPALIVRFSTLKGFLFIAVTGGLLYHLIAQYIRQSRTAEEALKSLNDELEERVVQRTEELETSRMALQRQNEELQEAYRGIEEETAKRLQAMEELRVRDRLMIHQSRMAATGEMLRNIAHQWRQPLNLLGLTAQEMSFRYKNDGVNDDNDDVVQSGIREMMGIIMSLSRTIDDFRSLADPDGEKTCFSVNDAVKKTISLIEERFKELHVTIEVETSEDMMVNGYPNGYAQALFNILVNARDAFAEGGLPDARLIVRAWKRDGKAVVTVTDNAGGIKEDDLEKIFDPFFTTKEPGEGTGIGLFMSKTMIEKKMGGSLTARNVAGCAEFRIELTEGCWEDMKGTDVYPGSQR